MLFFKVLRYKNLLSTGNTFTEIDLCGKKSTLIVGSNGAGKSTILDALCFVLYGKPFRKVNKGQLVNSINQKALLAEIEFDVGKKRYIVKRGIKPAIFEIWVNGQLLDQSAGVDDYQAMLESTILGMNMKSFCQIVILGSASFVPFMKLTAGSRREIVEDLLDIEVFSVMNKLLKSRMDANRDEIKELSYSIQMLEQKIDISKKHVSALKENVEERVAECQAKIDQHVAANQTMNEHLARLTTNRQYLEGMLFNMPTVQKRMADLHKLDIQLAQKANKLEAEVSFFTANEECPTCKQGIAHSHKTQLSSSLQKSLDNVKDALVKLHDEQENTANQMSDFRKIEKEIAALDKDIAGVKTEHRLNTAMITSLNEQIRQYRSGSAQIENNAEEIAAVEAQLAQEQATKEELLKDKQVMDVASALLKDTGIKTKIVKQYIPVMNKLINKYLAAMDFFVDFELNENFEEKIRSRFRDEFSYDSFSEGEKLRIDVSLLFTWRAIANMRNNSSTNLLILDEIFDRSLDDVGTEEFHKILDSLGDVNLFVISHKGDQLFDKFEHTIRFKKHKNFSGVA